MNSLLSNALNTNVQAQPVLPDTAQNLTQIANGLVPMGRKMKPRQMASPATLQAALNPPQMSGLMGTANAL